MPKKSTSRPPRTTSRPPRKGSSQESTLRIVGGRLRGSKLKYSGDQRVRPMKDRVREALFNLIGPAIRDTFVVDLFGGTGALALEAISRGASGGLILEQHHPTARNIRDNIAALGLSDQVQLLTVNTLHWYRENPNLPASPWAVFCSPPYRFFQEQRESMVSLMENLMHRAAAGSVFAVEATDEFDFSLLPDTDAWDVRRYPPAKVAVTTISSLCKPDTNSSPDGD